LPKQIDIETLTHIEARRIQMSYMSKLLKKWSRKRSSTRTARRANSLFMVESLEDRLLMSVTAVFAPGAGILTVTGDNQNNNVVVSRDAAGSLLVNGGAVKINGGTSTVANTSLIQIFGQGGDDAITLNEANGALPKSNIFGGAGNDTLTGGSGADMLFGQSGNDTLLGKGGGDFLFGGADQDVLTGGDADDQVFGESGNDRIVWNPGDDTDLNEGGDGVDTIEVNGGNGAETFTTFANGTRVRFDRTDPAPFSLDIGTSEKLVLNANGGNDTASAGNGLAALIQITMDGGTGDDTILGGDGNDFLFGGDGNDFVDGNRGADTAFLGAGNDTFQWDPGDGNDVVEGQDGTDKLLFNGANVAEVFNISANGGRALLTRNIANIVMDIDGVEHIDLNTLGGADAVTVQNLSATDLTEININQAASNGAGDAQIDSVTVNGTNGPDAVTVVGSGTDYAVLGLQAQVKVHGSEPTDRLAVLAGGGNDSVSAVALPAGVVSLTIDGQGGDDTILGSQGADVLLGGDGNDFVDGNQGADTSALGAGDDVFQWDPGDGSDIVDGETGSDILLFNGANVSERIDISASGARARFSRDVANITMDLGGIDRIDFKALGGADVITVNDLTGTDVKLINLALAGPNGGGDGQPDTVTVTGTNAADSVLVSGSGSTASVAGLAATVAITSSEGGNDVLFLNTLGSADVVDASGLAAGVIGLQIRGGSDADTLIGSAGDDTFVWNPGDGSDVVEGRDGFDTLLFNGSNIAEKIDISANGARGRLTRDVANIVMDFDDVEELTVNVVGGADTITVNDVAGTDVSTIGLNLAAVGGVGDGQPDTVVVQGTSGDDVIFVAGDAAGTAVLGLAAQRLITGAESANDRLVVNALAGDDVLTAEGTTATAIQLTMNGGENDDVLIGGDGNDILNGNEGDDVLIGGLGTDVLDGGSGDNILIQ
jgi:Ca2+-binding RTX toxin-like protein